MSTLVSARPAPPLSVVALSALSRLSDREARLRRANVRRAIGGLGVIVAVMAGSLLPVAWWGSVATRLPPPTIVRSADAPPSPLRTPLPTLAGRVLMIDSAIAVLMLPLAALTRRESHADIAGRILDQGLRCHGPNDNPLLRAVLVFIAVGVLYGEFLVIDAAKATWVTGRVRGADRHRAALAVGMLRSNPGGINVNLLRRVGDRPDDFHRLIAYLVVLEWATVNRAGTRLYPRSRRG